MAPRPKGCGPEHPLSRLPAYLHYQTRGGTGERANPYVYRGTPSRKMLEHYSHIRMAAKRPWMPLLSPFLLETWYKIRYIHRLAKT